MSRGIDTGYEGSPSSEEEGPVRWGIEKNEHQYSNYGLYIRFIRNGVSVGMSRVGTQEEFEWLRDRIDGVFDPEEVQGG